MDICFSQLCTKGDRGTILIGFIFSKVLRIRLGLGGPAAEGSVGGKLILVKEFPAAASAESCSSKNRDAPLVRDETCGKRFLATLVFGEKSALHPGTNSLQLVRSW